MLAVPVLVADHGLHAALLRIKLAHLRTALGARERHRFLERDQLRAALDARLNERCCAGCGSVQKQKTSGCKRLASAAASVPSAGLPSLAAAASSACRIDVADADDVETRVGVESAGVVHAALPMPTTDDGVSVLSRSYAWASVPLHAPWRSCSPLPRRSVRGTSAANAAGGVGFGIRHAAGDARALAPRIAFLLVDGDRVVGLGVDAVLSRGTQQLVAHFRPASSR